ncbi:MAG TPA: hypothetical protein VEF33_02885, partial [Syntrophales bacterium]|nr:hypothetical protein [Syntrophales bacterium]
KRSIIIRDSLIGFCVALPPLPRREMFSSRHSRESGNPVLRHWIPGRARNDKARQGTLTLPKVCADHDRR